MLSNFRNTYSSHSFGSPAHHAHPLASPRPPLGLPGCGRHYRAHFRPSRWSIRIDRLRWTETRVRPRPPVLFHPSIPFRRLSQKGRSCRAKSAPSLLLTHDLETAGEFGAFTLTYYPGLFVSQMENGDKPIPLGTLAHTIYTDGRKVEGCTLLSCSFYFILIFFSGVIS